LFLFDYGWGPGSPGPGHSPPEGRFWAIHYGEIFNHQELQKELEVRGHCFVTHSDTKVIVHA